MNSLLLHIRTLSSAMAENMHPYHYQTRILKIISESKLSSFVWTRALDRSLDPLVAQIKPDEQSIRSSSIIHHPSSCYYFKSWIYNSLELNICENYATFELSSRESQQYLIWRLRESTIMFRLHEGRPLNFRDLGTPPTLSFVLVDSEIP